MPINIPNSLPAAKVLERENIFYMSQSRAKLQDIRPLRILILNLMPIKIDTETQLLRLLGNTPLQVDVELMQTMTYTSKNTPSEHLLKFYITFADIRDERFDGMIITGAPVEQMPFERVDYWGELCEIMQWSKTHVYSTLHICWGAQAGLYFHHGIDKRPLNQKLSGIFGHQKLSQRHMLLRGFDDEFLAPHSRHTEIAVSDVSALKDVELLATSPEAGLYLAASADGRRIYCTGHSEYDRHTLANEYQRDQKKGMNPELPRHYFPDDNPKNEPQHRWRSHANLLYSNWLNYFVYQRTPYDLNELEK